MRKIDLIVVHCSATPAGRPHTAADIDRWHRERGFDGIGYHFVVRLDGTIEPGRPIEKTGAHCLGKNANSLGVCYIGGLDAAGHPADTRTLAQRAALRRLLRDLRQRFPKAEIFGHNRFAAKACPCFDAHKEYADI